MDFVANFIENTTVKES